MDEELWTEDISMLLLHLLLGEWSKTWLREETVSSVLSSLGRCHLALLPTLLSLRSQSVVWVLGNSEKKDPTFRVWLEWGPCEELGGATWGCVLPVWLVFGASCPHGVSLELFQGSI